VESLIITEGEFDAMAAYQSTGVPAVSLPFGASHLPDFLVKWLDAYPKLSVIYLWLDEDDAGRLNAPKMSKKLGYRRCRTVRPAIIHKYVDYPKDANDALLKHPQRIAEYPTLARGEL
jgi:twinkle protein